MLHKLVSTFALLAALVFSAPAASAANFTFTGTNASLVWGTGFQVIGASDLNADTFWITSALQTLPVGGLTFSPVVGDTQTALLGTIRSNESNVVGGEVNDLSVQISLILGGKNFVFTLQSSDLGVSPTGSIAANTTAETITFTSGNTYSTVQQILSDGINYFTIGAIIEWSDNGTTGWAPAQTISFNDIDTYRISMQVLNLEPVNPDPVVVPEPATYLIAGASLLALCVRRRRTAN